MGVRARQQATECAVALEPLDEQRDARNLVLAVFGGLFAREQQALMREGHLRSDDDLVADLFGGRVDPDGAVDPVAVAHREGDVIELGAALHHVLGVRGALEKRIASTPE